MMVLTIVWYGQVTSWQQDPSPTGTPAGNHETCSASEPLDLSSSEPSEPVLAARKSTNRGVQSPSLPPRSVGTNNFLNLVEDLHCYSIMY